MRRFLAFLERHGPCVVGAREFDVHAPDPAVRDALRACHVVRDGPLAASLPCGEADCARVVRHLRGGRFAAACTREPPACATLDVTRAELAQVAVSLEALCDLARHLFRIDPPGRPAAISRDAATLLGTQTEPRERDAWLALHPWTPAFRSWLAQRERAPRPSIVLLPTGAALDAELSARHGAGAYVEIEILADAWALRSGRIARARNLRMAPAPASPSSAPAAAASTLVPRASRWRDVHVHRADGESVIVRAGGRAQRLTHIDLGMAWRVSRKPKKTFELLLAVCEGCGTFRWRPFGNFKNACKVVSDARKALRAAFGIADDPFEPFSYAEQWRSKFHAYPEPPGETSGEGIA